MKKFATMAISIALIGTMVAGGSLAYLQDDDSTVNVMTLGNVSIEQHEYERETNADGTYATKTIDDVTSYVLKDFTQGKALLPIVGDPSESGNSLAYAGYDSTIVRMTQVGSYGGMDVFAGKNAQDKFVTVENTGKTDAYVRTLVAIEVGSTKDDGKLVKPSYHFTWKENFIGTFTIDDNEYKLYEYVYDGWNDGGRHVNGILPAGDTSYPNLSQIYLKHNADNEYCEALDGNGNGTLDILVLSQAVQAAGFENAQTALDTAFGTAKDNAAEWFGGVVNGTSVATEEELTKALAEGESVSLTADITLTSVELVTISDDVTINLNGYALDASANESRPFNVENGASLTINAEGAEVDCGAYGLVNMTEGTLTINGGTFITENGNNGSFIKVSGDEEMEINLNNITYKAGTTDSGVIRTSGSNVTVNVNGGTYEAGMGFLMENGSITGANITATNTANMWPAVYADGDITVTGCTIKSACHAVAVGGGNTVTVENCDVQAADGKLAFQVFSSGGTINVNNCTYTGGYGTTGKINTGCPDAVVNIDDVEVYRKSAQ